jgi:hypothetical protein
VPEKLSHETPPLEEVQKPTQGNLLGKTALQIEPSLLKEV